MLFGRRKPGYTTTVDSSVDPEQAVLDLQKAELAAKKKPKAEVFDIDAASETARRLKETGSSFDGSAAKTGEDVIAAVERETAELAAMQAAGAAPEAAETVQDEAAKPQLLDFLAGEPEAENDPFADQPTQTAPELPELTPAQELAGYIRSRSAAALITPHALLVSEVENADELLAQFNAVKRCSLAQNNPYKFVLDWFKAQFPHYKEQPDFGNNAPKVIDLAAFQKKREEKEQESA